MLRDERLKLAVLMTLHLVWGVVLWFSISKYGLGVSTDAVHLLSAAQNLAAGNGLTTYDGSFLALWPPLYPVLLAKVRLITGVDMLGAATIVQAIAFLGLGIALATLFLRIFSGRIIPAAAALVLTQVGEVVFSTAGMVGSDYVHLFLVVLVILLTARYVESGSRISFFWLAMATTLVTLQRYVGVAATATAMAAITLLGRTSWRRRITEALVLGLTALPMGIWLAVTSRTYSRRGPITFEENFTWFSRSVLEWFTGPIERNTELTIETAALWTGVLALVAAAVLLRRREGQGPPEDAERDGSRREAWPYVAVLLLYGFFYVMALFGSAATTYFNKLGGRFILPLYVPVMALPVIVSDGLVQAAKRFKRGVLTWALAGIGGLIVLGLGATALRTTYPVMLESRARGVAGGDNSFNKQTWHENPALGYWKEQTPNGEFLLFSNEPDGVAFHTQHAVKAAPRRITGPYGKDITPVAGFKDELFGAGVDVYLIWIEPSSYDYYYAPEDLEEISKMEALFSSDLGSVYRLSPRGED